MVLRLPRPCNRELGSMPVIQGRRCRHSLASITKTLRSARLGSETSFRYRLERMDRRRIPRIRQPEQPLATQPIETESKLRLPNFGRDPPAPSLTRKDETDLEILGAKCVARKQAGEPDNFVCWLFGQRGDPGEAVAKREESPHETFGSFFRHRLSGKGITHHITVAENSLLQDRDIVLGRSAEDQTRRRQNDDRFVAGCGIVIHRLVIWQFAWAAKRS
jgi:hypothetical protein